MQAGIVTLEDRMPAPCTGGYMYGRYWRCWDKRGHGNVNLKQAIEKSCDVYFYQLGLKLGLSRMLAGGISLKMNERTGIDLPNEQKPLYPASEAYFNEKYGERGWVAGSTVLNLSIGQGENTQTVANMARFYTALATDGHVARPEIVRRNPERTRIFKLTDAQMDGLRRSMIGVVSSAGTANSARIEGVTLAGKTGTAQNAENPNVDHAWFVGFAPAENPQIVVAVFLEFGEHGYAAAQVASKLIGRYLKKDTVLPPTTEGD
jgi:penicillin-binding protein 2